MSRSSTIVIALLVAVAWIGPAPAQAREKVLETVRNLESRLEQVDKFIRGLQNAQGGANQEEEMAAQATEIGRLRDTIATAVTEFADQLQVTEEALGVAERDAAGATLQLQEMTQRAEEAEEALAAAVSERESARHDNTRLAHLLEDATVKDEATTRDLRALEQRAEEAEAELAAERDQLGELEEELHLLRQELAASSQKPEASTTSGIPQELDAEGGIQIHINGGQVTFHINGPELLRVPTRTEDTPGDSNLHLRLPPIRDDAEDKNPPPGTPSSRPILRIHLP